MQLRPETDRAIRILLFLAMHRQDETMAAIPLSTLGVQLGIKRGQLQKITNDLAGLGYIEIEPGAEVRARLADEPSAITLGEIIEDFEGPICLLGRRETRFQRLGLVMGWAGRELEGFFAQYTLQQMLPATFHDTRRAPRRKRHLHLVETG